MRALRKPSEGELYSKLVKHGASLRKDYTTPPTLDLSYLDMSSANLTDLFLSFASLSGSNLSGATLDGAACFKTDFTGANFQGASLYDTLLQQSIMHGANLCGLRSYKRLYRHFAFNEKYPTSFFHGAKIDRRTLSLVVLD